MWLPSLVCDLMSVHSEYKDTPLMVRSAVAADFVFKCSGAKRLDVNAGKKEPGWNVARE